MSTADANGRAAGPAGGGIGGGPASGPAATSFYALGPEFEWLASAWDGFARDLADTAAALRHVVEATAADPAVAAESSGLSALESATERLARELVDDAERIRRTLVTYRDADAAVHAAVPGGVVPGLPSGTFPGPGPDTAAAVHGAPRFVPGTDSAPTGESPATGGVPRQPGGPDSSGHLWHPAVPDASGPAAEATALGTLSRHRRDILARAERWVAQRVPYSQETWHEGYRTDCSGFVSMCWGLRDSMVTSTFPQIAHRIAKEDLRPGDILDNTDVATGHVVLFDRWADYAHTSYVGYELCPGGTLHHVLPYPYYPGFGDFEPYRYDQAGD